MHELSVVPARRDVVREAHESATMKDAWKWNQQMSVGTKRDEGSRLHQPFQKERSGWEGRVETDMELP